MITQQSMIHRIYHRKTGYLLGNVDAGIREFVGTGYHVDEMQMTWTNESQMMMSHGSDTNRSHKSIAKRIAQNDHAKQDDVTSRNGNDKQDSQMLQSNSGVYGGPDTG